MNTDKFEFKEQYLDKNVNTPICGGNQKYLDYYDRKNWKLLTTNKKHLEEELTDAISFFGRDPDNYNPVGGPVIVKELVVKQADNSSSSPEE